MITSDDSDASKNKIPPWCSSGKLFRKGKLPPREIRSSYPLRENIWEYLGEGRGQTVIRGKKRQCNCKKERKPGRNGAVVFALVIIASGLMASIWTNNFPKINLLTKVIQRDKLVSLVIGERREMTEECRCCSKIKYLSFELSKVQHILRHAQRVRRTMISTQVARNGNKEVEDKYIEGATVTKGSDTPEYEYYRVSFWDIVPLWRAGPPPDVVLAQRKPTPSDCWPFSGQLGHIVIELPQATLVRYLSVEHIRPDTARSAPKEFILYSISGNGTWITAMKGEYKTRGPAKQYYQSNWREPVSRLVFKVLSNQGNPKYTCIYRVHLYRT